MVAYAALGFSRRLDARLGPGCPPHDPRLGAEDPLAFAAVILAARPTSSKERSRNVSLASLKGIPIVVVIVGFLLVVLTFLLTRTAWGRHVYAVGGNAEAARRAGINVDWVRISCFMMCSSLAAMGGVMLASRTTRRTRTPAAPTMLLFAVGAAVIGGTSLFGGRGRVLDAVLGAAWSLRS